MTVGIKISCLLAPLLLAGCSGPLAEYMAKPNEGVLPPVLNPVTRINETLRHLPPPKKRVAIAVYGYTDQTGQRKATDSVQLLSSAVTQGATSVLIKALQDAGNGSWFMVVEREKLSNLLKERSIIANMRNVYLGERKVNPHALPPLLFAGVLLEGGIIGYDSNVRTGGAGARYLGIGGDVQYREDTITVYLRAVSTKTGEVLLTTVAHKTIISVGVRGSAFKYVALDKILEAEAGITHNEPEQIAVQQAIEKAVHAMIIEGAARNVWNFADKNYQSEAISKLDKEQEMARALNKNGNLVTPTAVARTVKAAPNRIRAAHNAPQPATTQKKRKKTAPVKKVATVKSKAVRKTTAERKTATNVTVVARKAKP
jgi:curli production assembly/transport component CsgG